MRAMLVGVLVALTAACGPRQVEVRTGQPEPSQVSLAVTNNLNQAVNIYVEHQGNEMLVGSVAAGSFQQLAVHGVPSGASVRISARTQDGQRTYRAQRGEAIVLTATYNWQLP